jgi:hypothetical protein
VARVASACYLSGTQFAGAAFPGASAFDRCTGQVRDKQIDGYVVGQRFRLLRVFPLQNTFSSVSKAEILEQLPKLNSIELREIRDRIWQLEEEELLTGRAEPSDEERALLDREFEDFERDPTSGSSWEEVKSRLET